ncbi:hypothetical protein KIPB_000761 [Kipferlia bialata]|uniref:Midasin n=1 Tax=Kipferlia bialata TaxID=797122 RepID=A0A9K3CPN3_9EUKA|nr:hypothetical protein KIPB_000761 [Kipferlia bialata]|eukprot:g761.t1
MPAPLVTRLSRLLQEYPSVSVLSPPERVNLYKELCGVATPHQLAAHFSCSNPTRDTLAFVRGYHAYVDHRCSCTEVVRAPADGTEAAPAVTSDLLILQPAILGDSEEGQTVRTVETTMIESISTKSLSSTVHTHSNSLGDRDVTSRFIVTQPAAERIAIVESLLEAGSVPVLLEGPTGTAKTSTVCELARRKGQRLERFNLSEHTATANLLGRIEVTASEDRPFMFREGAFTKAYEKGYWLLLDELNLGGQGVLQCLEAVLDNDILALDTLGTTREIPRHPDFRLICTQNPSSGSFKGMRHELPPEFLSRFRKIIFPDLDHSEMTAIVQHILEGGQYPKARGMASTLASFHQDASRLTCDGIMTVLTLREMKLCAEIIAQNHRANVGELVYTVYGARYSANHEGIARALLKNGFRKGRGAITATLPVPSLSTEDRGRVPDYLYLTAGLERSLSLGLHAARQGRHVLYFGKSGSGVSALARLTARLLAGDRDPFCLIVTPDTTIDDIVGHMVPAHTRHSRDEVTQPSMKSTELLKWESGPVLAAAQQGVGCVLDNINQGESTTLERLNPLLETNIVLDRETPVFDASEFSAESQELGPGFRIFATATLDDKKLALSPAFINRFSVVRVCDQIDLSHKAQAKAQIEGIARATLTQAQVRVTIPKIPKAREEAQEAGLSGPQTQSNTPPATPAETPVPLPHAVCAISVQSDSEGSEYEQEEHTDSEESDNSESSSSSESESESSEFEIPQSDEDGAMEHESPMVGGTVDPSDIGIGLVGIGGEEEPEESSEDEYVIPVTRRPVDELVPLVVECFGKFRAENKTVRNLVNLCRGVSRLGDVIEGAAHLTVLATMLSPTGISREYSIPDGDRKVLLESVEEGYETERFFYKGAASVESLVCMVAGVDIVHSPLLIEGPAGIGKSECARFYARARKGKNTQLMSLTCSADTRPEHFFGQAISAGGGFSFSPGPAVLAMERGHVLCVDELNLCAPSILQALLPVLEAQPGECIRIPGRSEPLAVHPDFVFVATQNTFSGHGRQRLPHSLLSRFVVARANPLTEQQLTAICTRILRPTLDTLPDQLTAKRLSSLITQANAPASAKSKPYLYPHASLTLRDIRRLLKRLEHPKVWLPYQVCTLLTQKVSHRLTDIRRNLVDLVATCFDCDAEALMKYQEGKVAVSMDATGSATLTKGPDTARTRTRPRHYVGLNLVNQPQPLLQALYQLELCHAEENILLVGGTSYKGLILTEILRSRGKEDVEDISLTRETTTTLLAGSQTVNNHSRAMLVFLDLLQVAARRLGGPLCKVAAEAHHLAETIQSSTGLDRSGYEAMINQAHEDATRLLDEFTKDVVSGQSVVAYKNQEFIENALNNALRIVKPPCSHDSVPQADSALRQLVTIFSIGRLTRAAVFGTPLILRNVALPAASVLERMNPLLEMPPTYTLPEDAASTITQNNDATVPVCKGMNVHATATERQLNDLSHATRSRFTEISVAPYTESDVQQVVLGVAEDVLQTKGCRTPPDTVASLINSKALLVRQDSHLSLKQVLCWTRLAASLVSTGMDVPTAVSVAGVKAVADRNSKKWSEMVRHMGLDTITPALQQYAQWRQNPKANDTFMRQSLEKTTLRSGQRVTAPYSGARMRAAASSGAYDFDEYTKTPTLLYLLDTIITCVQANVPGILKGPPGLAKSSAFEAIQRATGHRVTRLNLSNSTTVEDLFGRVMSSPEEGAISFEFQKGELTDAIEWTPESEDKDSLSPIVLLDELNLAPAAVIDAITPLFKPGTKRLLLPSGNVMPLRHFHLFATVNPASSSSGRGALDRSLTDNAVLVELPSYRTPEVVAIAHDVLGCVPYFQTEGRLQRAVEAHFAAGQVMRTTSSGSVTLRELIKMRQLVESTKSSLPLDVLLRLLYVSPVQQPETRERLTRELGLRVANADIPKAMVHYNDNTYSVGHLRLERGPYTQMTSEYPLYETVSSTQLRYMQDVTAAVCASRVCLLQGNSDSGKTYIVRALAALSGHKLNIVQLHTDTDTTSITGRLEPCMPQTDRVRRVLEEVETLVTSLTSRLVEKTPHKTTTEVTWPALLSLLSELWSTETSGATVATHLETLVHSLSFKEGTEEATITHALGTAAEELGTHTKEMSMRFEYRDSLLISAMRKGEWVLFDNIHAAPNDVVERLNSLAEENPTLTVYEQGTGHRFSMDAEDPKYRISPNFRLFLTADNSRSFHSGSVSGALLSRCVVVSTEPTIMEGLSCVGIIFALLRRHIVEDTAREVAFKLVHAFRSIWKSERVQSTQISFRTLLFTVRAFLSLYRSNADIGQCMGKAVYLALLYSNTERTVVQPLVLAAVSKRATEVERSLLASRFGDQSHRLLPLYRRLARVQASFLCGVPQEFLAPCISILLSGQANGPVPSDILLSQVATTVARVQIAKATVASVKAYTHSMLVAIRDGIKVEDGPEVVARLRKTCTLARHVTRSAPKKSPQRDAAALLSSIYPIVTCLTELSEACSDEHGSFRVSQLLNDPSVPAEVQSAAAKLHTSTICFEACWEAEIPAIAFDKWLHALFALIDKKNPQRNAFVSAVLEYLIDPSNSEFGSDSETVARVGAALKAGWLVDMVSLCRRHPESVVRHPYVSQKKCQSVLAESETQPGAIHIFLSAKDGIKWAAVQTTSSYITCDTRLFTEATHTFTRHKPQDEDVCEHMVKCNGSRWQWEPMEYDEASQTYTLTKSYGRIEEPLTEHFIIRRNRDQSDTALVQESIGKVFEEGWRKDNVVDIQPVTVTHTPHVFVMRLLDLKVEREELLKSEDATLDYLSKVREGTPTESMAVDVEPHIGAKLLYSKIITCKPNPKWVPLESLVLSSLSPVKRALWSRLLCSSGTVRNTTQATGDISVQSLLHDCVCALVPMPGIEWAAHEIPAAVIVSTVNNITQELEEYEKQSKRAHKAREKGKTAKIPDLDQLTSLVLSHTTKTAEEGITAVRTTCSAGATAGLVQNLRLAFDRVFSRVAAVPTLRPVQSLMAMATCLDGYDEYLRTEHSRSQMSNANKKLCAQLDTVKEAAQRLGVSCPEMRPALASLSRHIETTLSTNQSSDDAKHKWLSKRLLAAQSLYESIETVSAQVVSGVSRDIASVSWGKTLPRTPDGYSALDVRVLTVQTLARHVLSTDVIRELESARQNTSRVMELLPQLRKSPLAELGEPLCDILTENHMLSKSHILMLSSAANATTICELHRAGAPLTSSSMIECVAPSPPVTEEWAHVASQELLKILPHPERHAMCVPHYTPRDVLALVHLNAGSDQTPMAGPLFRHTLTDQVVPRMKCLKADLAKGVTSCTQMADRMISAVREELYEYTSSAISEDVGDIEALTGYKTVPDTSFMADLIDGVLEARDIAIELDKNKSTPVSDTDTSDMDILQCQFPLSVSDTVTYRQALDMQPHLSQWLYYNTSVRDGLAQAIHRCHYPEGTVSAALLPYRVACGCQPTTTTHKGEWFRGLASWAHARVTLGNEWHHPDAAPHRVPLLLGKSILPADTYCDMVVSGVERIDDVVESLRHELGTNARENAVGDKIESIVRGCISVALLGTPQGETTRHQQIHSPIGEMANPLTQLVNLQGVLVADLQAIHTEEQRKLKERKRTAEKRLEQSTGGIRTLLGEVKTAYQTDISAIKTRQNGEHQRRVNEWLADHNRVQVAIQRTASDSSAYQRSLSVVAEAYATTLLPKPGDKSAMIAITNDIPLLLRASGVLRAAANTLPAGKVISIPPESRCHHFEVTCDHALTNPRLECHFTCPLRVEARGATTTTTDHSTSAGIPLQYTRPGHARDVVVTTAGVTGDTTFTVAVAGTDGEEQTGQDGFCQLTRLTGMAAMGAVGVREAALNRGLVLTHTQLLDVEVPKPFGTVMSLATALSQHESQYPPSRLNQLDAACREHLEYPPRPQAPTTPALTVLSHPRQEIGCLLDADITYVKQRSLNQNAMFQLKRDLVALQHVFKNLTEPQTQAFTLFSAAMRDHALAIDAAVKNLDAVLEFASIPKKGYSAIVAHSLSPVLPPPTKPRGLTDWRWTNKKRSFRPSSVKRGALRSAVVSDGSEGPLLSMPRVIADLGTYIMGVNSERHVGSLTINNSAKEDVVITLALTAGSMLEVYPKEVTLPTRSTATFEYSLTSDPATAAPITATGSITVAYPNGKGKQHTVPLLVGLRVQPFYVNVTSSEPLCQKLDSSALGCYAPDGTEVRLALSVPEYHTFPAFATSVSSGPRNTAHQGCFKFGSTERSLTLAGYSREETNLNASVTVSFSPTIHFDAEYSSHLGRMGTDLYQLRQCSNGSWETDRVSTGTTIERRGNVKEDSLHFVVVNRCVQGDTYRLSLSDSLASKTALRGGPTKNLRVVVPPGEADVFTLDLSSRKQLSGVLSVTLHSIRFKVQYTGKRSLAITGTRQRRLGPYNPHTRTYTEENRDLIRITNSTPGPLSSHRGYLLFVSETGVERRIGISWERINAHKHNDFQVKATDYGTYYLVCSDDEDAAHKSHVVHMKNPNSPRQDVCFDCRYYTFAGDRLDSGSTHTTFKPMHVEIRVKRSWNSPEVKGVVPLYLFDIPMLSSEELEAMSRVQRCPDSFCVALCVSLIAKMLFTQSENPYGIRLFTHMSTALTMGDMTIPTRYESTLLKFCQAATLLPRNNPFTPSTPCKVPALPDIATDPSGHGREFTRFVTSVLRNLPRRQINDRESRFSHTSFMLGVLSSRVSGSGDMRSFARAFGLSLPESLLNPTIIHDRGDGSEVIQNLVRKTDTLLRALHLMKQAQEVVKLRQSYGQLKMTMLPSVRDMSTLSSSALASKKAAILNTTHSNTGPSDPPSRDDALRLRQVRANIQDYRRMSQRQADESQRTLAALNHSDPHTEWVLNAQGLHPAVAVSAPEVEDVNLSLKTQEEDSDAVASDSVIETYKRGLLEIEKLQRDTLAFHAAVLKALAQQASIFPLCLSQMLGDPNLALSVPDVIVEYFRVAISTVESLSQSGLSCFNNRERIAEVEQFLLGDVASRLAEAELPVPCHSTIRQGHHSQQRQSAFVVPCPRGIASPCNESWSTNPKNSDEAPDQSPAEHNQEVLAQMGSKVDVSALQSRINYKPVVVPTTITPKREESDTATALRSLQEADAARLAANAIEYTHIDVSRPAGIGRMAREPGARNRHRPAMHLRRLGDWEEETAEGSDNESDDVEDAIRGDRDLDIDNQPPTVEAQRLTVDEYDRLYPEDVTPERMLSHLFKLKPPMSTDMASIGKMTPASFPPTLHKATAATQALMNCCVPVADRMVSKVLVGLPSTTSLASHEVCLLLDLSRTVDDRKRDMQHVVALSLMEALSSLEVAFSVAVFSHREFFYVLKDPSTVYTAETAQRVCDALRVKRKSASYVLDAVAAAATHVAGKSNCFSARPCTARSIVIVSDLYSPHIVLEEADWAMVFSKINAHVVFAQLESSYSDSSLGARFQERVSAVVDKAVNTSSSAELIVVPEDVMSTGSESVGRIDTMLVTALHSVPIRIGCQKSAAPAPKVPLRSGLADSNGTTLDAVGADALPNIALGRGQTGVFSQAATIESLADGVDINANIESHLEPGLCSVEPVWGDRVTPPKRKAVSRAMAGIARTTRARVQAATSAVGTTIMPPNVATKWCAVEYGTIIDIQRLLRFIMTRGQERKFYLSKQGGYKRMYSCSVVIDLSDSTMCAANKAHTFTSAILLLQTLAMLELPSVDVLLSTGASTRVLASGIRASDMFDKTHPHPLFPALFSAMQERHDGASMGSAVGHAVQMQDVRPASGGNSRLVFALTDGMVSSDAERARLLTAQSYARAHSIEVIGVGVGMRPVFLSRVYASCCFAPSPYDIDSAICGVFTPSALTGDETIEEVCQELALDPQTLEAVDTTRKEAAANTDLVSTLRDHVITEDFYNQKSLNLRAEDGTCNPDGNEYDLGKCGYFTDVHVLVCMFYTYRDNNKDKQVTPACFNTGAKGSDSSPRIKLEEKGFSVTVVHDYMTAIRAICSGKYRVTYVVCSPGDGILPKEAADPKSSNLVGQFTDYLIRYWNTGGSVAFFADNEPFYYEANLFLERVRFGTERTRLQLTGNYVGKKQLSERKSSSASTGTFNSPTKVKVEGRHYTRATLSAGLRSIYEGHTVCYPKPGPIAPFEAFAYNSNTESEQPTILTYDPPCTSSTGTIVVDTAASRLFYEYSAEGTARYISNIAVWSLRLAHLRHELDLQDITRPLPAITVRIDQTVKWTWPTPVSRPVHHILILDDSGSMSGSWASLMKAVNNFQTTRAKSSPQDRWTIIKFSVDATAVCVNEPITTVPSISFGCGGNTNLHLATRECDAKKGSYPSSHTTRVLCFTDGGTNGKEECLAWATKVHSPPINWTVDAIGFASAPPEFMSSLARNGGGQYAFARTPEELTSHFEEFAMAD